MVRKRVRWLIVLICVPYLAILARLYSLQVVEAGREHWQLLALHRKPGLIAPVRGRILAAGGEPLATHEAVYHLEFRYEDRGRSAEPAGLNSRLPALSVLSRALRAPLDASGRRPADDPFGDPERIEDELLRIAGFPGCVRWFAEGPEEETSKVWLPLVDWIPEQTGKSLEELLKRHADILQVKALASERWQVLFHPRAALRMERSLWKLASLLPGERRSATGEVEVISVEQRFEELRRTVTTCLERIDRLVEREVEAYALKEKILDAKQEGRIRELRAEEVKARQEEKAKDEKEEKEKELREAAARAPEGEAAGEAGDAGQVSPDEGEEAPEASFPWVFEERLGPELAGTLVRDQRLKIDAKRRGARRAYRVQVSWPLAAAVAREVVTEVEYHPELHAGISVVATTHRRYPAGEVCATLVGRTRRLSDDEIEANESQERVLDRLRPDQLLDTDVFLERREGGVRGNDEVGSSGLEALWDRDLRGAYGREVVTVDSRGRKKVRVVLDEIAPSHGRDIRTVLDLPLQRLVFEALKKRVDEDGIGKSGAAAVMDVSDERAGALLASAGVPGVDPHRPQDAKHALELKGRGGSFLDRPSRIPLYPGSVFKLVVATAALEDPTPWDPWRSFSCARTYRAGASCSGSHGEINLLRAIQASCNVYFYHLGDEILAPANLRGWATAFGYGLPAGIDPGPPEPAAGRTVRGAAGRLVDLDKLRPAATVRDRCQYAIGQVHVEATPLQVLRSVAAVARGLRDLPRPYLVSHVAPDRFPQAHDLEARARTVQVLHEGLWKAGHEPGGTAYKEAGSSRDAAVARLQEWSAAFKTGTAERYALDERGRIVRDGAGDPVKVNTTWLVGFAPFHSPRIAFVAVLDGVPDGVHAAHACAPVVHAILERFAAGDPSYLATRETAAAPSGIEPEAR